MGTCRNDIRLSHYKQVREKEEAKTVSNNDFIKMTHAKKTKRKVLALAIINIITWIF